MVLFVIFGVMTVVALVLLVPPLLRRPGGEMPRADYDLEIYRDQLKELDRDVERGVITSEQAAAARTEIERRMLAAAPADDAEPAAMMATTPTLIAAFAVIVTLPLLAGSLYLWLGSPDLEDQPFAARELAAAPATGQAGVLDIETMVAGLAERLKTMPDDLEGWIMLARSYGVLERYDDAIAALQHARTLSDKDPGIVTMLGEFHIFAADGVVTPRAVRFFEQALALEPRQPSPRFYLGLAKAQAGELRAALDDWLALAREAPADAPYLSALRTHIDDVAGRLGVDVAGLLPETPAAPAPTRQDVENAGEMSAADRQEMVRTMVARLAARLESEPDDLEGWKRLGRSYGVLGEAKAARDAYAKAAALAPDDPVVLQNYAAAIIEAAPGGTPLPAEAVTVAQRLADLDADNPAALWLLGRAEAERGNREAALALWRRLLVQLPPDGPDHDAISRAIEQLDTAPSGG